MDSSSIRAGHHLHRRPSFLWHPGDGKASYISNISKIRVVVITIMPGSQHQRQEGKEGVVGVIIADGVGDGVDEAWAAG